MLYVNTDGTIQLTRGDTARLSVDINNDVVGDKYEIQSEDLLFLTVRKRVSDSQYSFQKKVVGSNTFHILPSDTEELSFGKYVYDVQLTTKEGDVYTVIGPSTFEILKEVTY